MTPLMMEDGEGVKALLSQKALIIKSGDSCIVLKGEVWKAIRKAIVEGGGMFEHGHPAKH